MANKLKKIFSGFGTTVDKLGKVLGVAFTSFMNEMKLLFGGDEYKKELADKAKSGFEAIDPLGMGEAMGKAAHKKIMKGELGGPFEGLANRLKKVFDPVVSVFNSFIEGFKEMFGMETSTEEKAAKASTNKNIEFAEKIGLLPEEWGNKLQENIKADKGAAAAAAGATKEEGFFASIVTSVKKLPKFFEDFPKLEIRLTSIEKTFKDTFDELKNTFMEFTDTLLATIHEMTFGLAGRSLEQSAAIRERDKENVLRKGRGEERLPDIPPERSKIGKGWDTLQEKIGNVYQKIAETHENFKKFTVNAGNNIISGAKNTAANAKAKIGNAMGTAVDYGKQTWNYLTGTPEKQEGGFTHTDIGKKLYWLHDNELVVPKEETDMLRNVLANAGAGGGMSGNLEGMGEFFSSITSMIQSQLSTGKELVMSGYNAVIGVVSDIAAKKQEEMFTKGREPLKAIHAAGVGAEREAKIDYAPATNELMQTLHRMEQHQKDMAFGVSAMNTSLFEDGLPTEALNEGTATSIKEALTTLIEDSAIGNIVNAMTTAFETVEASKLREPEAGLAREGIDFREWKNEIGELTTEGSMEVIDSIVEPVSSVMDRLRESFSHYTEVVQNVAGTATEMIAAKGEVNPLLTPPDNVETELERDAATGEAAGSAVSMALVPGMDRIEQYFANTQKGLLENIVKELSAIKESLGQPVGNQIIGTSRFERFPLPTARRGRPVPLSSEFNLSQTNNDASINPSVQV